MQRSAAGVLGLGSGVVDYLGDGALRPTRWDTATTSVLVLAPRVRQMLRAVQLSRGWADPPYGDAAGAQERYLHRSFAALARTDEPPANWKSWTADFWTLRAAIMGGSAPPDSVFFAAAWRYAARTGAPPAVQAAVGFGTALASLDAGTAAAASGILVAEAREGRYWIPADDLLDGAVRSLLAVHDVTGARNAYSIVRPASARPPDDARLALLRAWIDRADQGTRTEP
jgi:hypothetical protein